MEQFTSILIATFSRHEKGRSFALNAMIEPLLSFFLPKAKKIVLIDQPYPGSDIVIPVIEIYKKGKLSKVTRSSKPLYLLYPFLKRVNYDATHISFKIRDFFSVLDCGLRERARFDVFIGLESINTLAGIVLRKFGKVKTVVYYVSDYSPVRYGKTLFNALYLTLDRFCVTHADFTWDVSPDIQKGRIDAGLSIKKKYRVIYVPNGVHASQIASLPVSQKSKDALVYMGILEPDLGVDLAIQALKEVRKKRASTKLHIIGGGDENLPRLKELIKSLGLTDAVVFHGFVHPNKEMADILTRCYIGLAPYRKFSTSIREYGDPGKIRQYLACGLPVITTDVTWYGRYIVQKGAGVIAKDTVEDMTNNILMLLSDIKLYKKLSNRAKKLGRKNTWLNSYARAFRTMERLERFKTNF